MRGEKWDYICHGESTPKGDSGGIESRFNSGYNAFKMKWQEKQNDRKMKRKIRKNNKH